MNKTGNKVERIEEIKNVFITQFYIIIINDELPINAEIKNNNYGHLSYTSRNGYRTSKG